MIDTFRKVYKPLRQENTDLILAIKNKAEELEALMKTVKSREMSLAITNLEQSIMWSTKAVVLFNEESNNEP